MATSQKRSGGSRASSGGRRTSSASKGKSSSSRSRKQPPAPAHRPYRREVGAGICLLLAIFTLFGCFHIQALFINALCGLIKGLIGYGFWLMPAALLLASFILAFHRGRPVRLRVFCALMLPLMFSCVVHSVIAESLPWDASLAQTLWQSGEALSSGGVLSGVLGQAFVQVFSRVGAAVVFVLALLMLGLGAFNRTIVDVADWFFSRPRYEYALAKLFPSARVEAWDISEEALQVARENARRHGANVCFRRCDLLEEAGKALALPAESAGTFPEKRQYFSPQAQALSPAPGQKTAPLAALVSNPPYVLPSEEAQMAPEVCRWEPREALFVPQEDPLLPYRALARLGRKRLAAGGKIYLELNPLLAAQVEELLRAAGFGEVRLVEDFDKKLRFITGTNPFLC